MSTSELNLDDSIILDTGNSLNKYLSVENELINQD